MIEHYDAFISYKHSEIDSDIAATVQRELEHFHIPAAIRKKQGKKKIQRIFRDKDELPITSSLTETITNALINSEYLIVICSTRTHESIWVDREIRTFLENHDRSRVLTVLVDGEPMDVIPQVLLSEEKEIIDEEGNVAIVNVPLEPLSCDYRIGKKAAKKIELPRLAATIIGCSYDELINRNRQYAMRRMTAVMAAVMALSIGFGAYMLYTNYKVNEAYKESLASQSRYLAGESQTMLADGRRVTAIQLALAALPGKSNRTRPVMPQAVRALTDASLSYVPSNAVDYLEKWVYRMPNNVKQMVIYDAEDYYRYLVALDAGNNVKCWEQSTHTELISIPDDGDEVLSVVAASKDIFLTISANYVKAYDAFKGKLIWTFGGEDEICDFDGTCLMADENTAYIMSSYGSVNKLDIRTGEKLDFFEYLTVYSAQTEELGAFFDFSLSPSGDKIAFTVMTLSEDGEDFFSQIGSYDIKTKELKVSEKFDPVVSHISWVKDDMIVVSMSESKKTYGDLDINYTAYFPKETDIIAINPEDMSFGWKYTLVSNAQEKGTDLVYMSATDRIAFYSGNMGVVLNTKDGSEYARVDANDTIVACKNITDDKPLFFTYSGEMIDAGDNSDYGLSPHVAMKWGPSNTVLVNVMGGLFFVRENDTEISCFWIDMYDEEFTEIVKGIPIEKYENNWYLDDDYFMLISDDDKLYVCESRNAAFIGTVDIAGSGINRDSVTILGQYDGKIFFSDLEDDKNFVLYTVDIRSREIEKRVVVENYGFKALRGALKDGKFLYVSGEKGAYKLNCEWLSDGSHEEFPIKGEGASLSDPILLEGTNTVFIAGENEILIDMDAGSQTELKRDANYRYITGLAYSSEHDMLARTDGISMAIYNRNGRLIKRMNTIGSHIIDLFFYDKDLVAICENGYMYRCSTFTGAVRAKTHLTFDVGNDGITFDITCDYDKNLVYIHSGEVTDIIDMESFYEITSMETSFGYHKPTDTFWSYSLGDKFQTNNIGWFRHYSLEELVEKASESIEGAELSPELKARYGIN